jgi:hypothetical protein
VDRCFGDQTGNHKKEIEDRNQAIDDTLEHHVTMKIIVRRKKRKVSLEHDLAAAGKKRDGLRQTRSDLLFGLRECEKTWLKLRRELVPASTLSPAAEFEQRRADMNRPSDFLSFSTYALQVHLFIADPSLSNDGREIRFPSLSKVKSVFLSDQSLTVPCDILAIAIPAASPDFHARTAGSRYTAT